MFIIQKKHVILSHSEKNIMSHHAKKSNTSLQWTQNTKSRINLNKHECQSRPLPSRVQWSRSHLENIKYKCWLCSIDYFPWGPIKPWTHRNRSSRSKPNSSHPDLYRRNVWEVPRWWQRSQSGSACHTNPPCWPTESRLVSKWLLCELCPPLKLKRAVLATVPFRPVHVGLRYVGPDNLYQP